MRDFISCFLVFIIALLTLGVGASGQLKSFGHSWSSDDGGSYHWFCFSPSGLKVKVGGKYSPVKSHQWVVEMEVLNSQAILFQLVGATLALRKRVPSGL